jgi:Holliday junction resolvase RusA-like endonuclease
MSTPTARSLDFVILGAPRTKKTSNAIRCIERGSRCAGPGGCGLPLARQRCGRCGHEKPGRMAVFPSDQNRQWTATALPQLRLVVAGRDPLTVDVNVAAVFYRDADRGDATGYMQALADALQEAGVLKNDEQIKSWDGTRLRVDRTNPRIEVEITRMEAEQASIFPTKSADVAALYRDLGRVARLEWRENDAAEFERKASEEDPMSQLTPLSRQIRNRVLG